MLLSNTAIKNRTTVLVVVLGIMAAGILSYTSLPRESTPDIEIPFILITTTNPGVSPEDIENTITIPIENKLTGIKGVKEVSSTSSEGMSIIVCEFHTNIDIENALQRVKDKVDQARPELPADGDEPIDPVVTEVDITDFPVITIALTGKISSVRMKVLAERLEDEIEAVQGVLEVDVVGAPEREIILEIDPDRVEQYGLSANELLGLLQRENLNQTAGSLETAGMRFSIRVPGEFEDPSEVDTLVIATRGDQEIYLSDVATVQDTFKDRNDLSRVNGKSSITLNVKRRTGENIVDMSDRIKQILAVARTKVPAGTELIIVNDRSDKIRMMIGDLENNIATGFLLVVLVLMVFMGLRSSMIVAMAIPLSMLMSFAILDLMGVTLNMVVLFALILALGMLVDNAIVIVENIYRFMEMGYGRMEAAMKGTAEVAWPVIASTATTIAAFAPLLFWPGTMGEFMQYIPLTVIVVLSSSCFVAMIVNPVICSIFARPGKHRPEAAPDNWIYRNYRIALAWALDKPVATLLLAVMVLIGAGITYKHLNHGLVLFPKTDPDEAAVRVRAPQGTNLYETDRITREIEGIVDTLIPNPNGGEPRIKHHVANVGRGSGDPLSGGGHHLANLNLTFPDYEDRLDAAGKTWTSEGVLDEIREAMNDRGPAGIEFQVQKQEGGPPQGEAVEVRIIGEEMRELEIYSNRVREMIRDVPGLINVRSDLEAEKPELVFIPDRQRAGKLNVSTALISNFLKTSIFGTKVSEYRQFNDEYDIRVRMPLEQRTNIDDILRLRVITDHGDSIPIGTLGRFEYRPGLGTIHRVDRDRVVRVTGSVSAKSGRTDMEVLADVKSILGALGRAKVRTTDVKDWPALIDALTQWTDPGTLGEIQDRLDHATKELLTEAKSNPAAMTDTQKKAIVAGLNKLLATQNPLWKDAAFASVKLPDTATKLIEMTEQPWLVRRRLAQEKLYPSDDDLKSINRLILNDVLDLTPSPTMTLSSDYTLKYAGQQEDTDEATGFLGKAFLFALLLIVAILVAQFNTLTAPLIIMTTIVLSLVGVLIGLLVFEMPFNIIMTGVGVISLAGVVVNNAIVLLDYTRQLQERGKGLEEAAMEAGMTRLRPVVLTAVTTILGLLPMVTGISFDFHAMELATRSTTSQYWKPMASAVVTGLSFATLLTLLVVPALYVLLFRIISRFGSGGLHKGADPTKHPPVLEDF